MNHAAHRGFTLVEMAVILVIAGLLLGGLVTSLAAFQQNQRVQETNRHLAEAREALLAFAVIHRRLPCPATSTVANTTPGAGVERPPVALGCTGGQNGVLPWATLGLRETDGWGRRVSYRVSAAFSGAAPAFALLSAGDISVENRAAVMLADTVPAILVSHGPNARGSFGPGGSPAPASGDPAEIANADLDASFISDTPTDQFDDIVTWVPRPLLVGRMLQAGQLP